MERFRTIGQYVETRAALMGYSIRALSIELDWSEGYLDGVRKNSFSMSSERARELGRFINEHLHDVKPSGSPSLEEYISVILSASMPWPPPSLLPDDMLASMASDLDAVSLLELVNYAQYLRTRPRSNDGEPVALPFAVNERQELYNSLPEPILNLARRIAELPDETQKETVSQLQETVAFVEKVAGVKRGP